MPELLTESGTISASFKASNANSLLNVCDVPAILKSIPGYDELENDYYLGVEFNLESLKAAVDLRNSLGEAPFPPIKASDESPVRLSKFAEIINGYPKLGIEILKGDDKKIGGFDLQNKGIILDIEMRYPFLSTGYVKLLGAGDRLKLRLYDYGDGLIKGSKDYIAIEGDYTLKINGVRKNQQTSEQPVVVSTGGVDTADITLIQEKLIALQEGLTKVEQLLEDGKPTIAELKSMNIVNFSTGILTVKPYTVSLAVQLTNWFPWIQNWNLASANELRDLHPISDIKSPLRQLNLSNCSKLKNIKALKHLTTLERLTLYRVDCSQSNLPDIIQANLALHYLDVRQTHLTSSQVDAILTSFENTKTQRMAVAPPTSFNILLSQNESPSENGIAIINNLRADGWSISYS